MAGLRPTGIEYPVGSGIYIDIDRDTSDYQAMFLADQSYVVVVTPASEARRNATGLLNSISVDGRTIPMSIIRDPAGAATSADFHANVKRWFDPGKGRAGTRFLRILGDDGATSLRLPVHVVSLQPRPGSIDVYDVVFSSVTPYFEALTEDSDAITTTGTVTNDGNARAQATLEVTGGDSTSGNQYTLTDNTGHGLVNYPFVIADTAPVTSQADSFVLIGGKSVAFTQGATSADYWIFVDLPAGGSVTIDVLRDTGVTNPLAGTLDIGNLDASNTDTTQHAWDTWNVRSAPVRSGIWHIVDPRIRWSQSSTINYGITIDDDSSLVFNLSTTSTQHYNKDATAVLMQTGVPGAVSATLVGLSRVLNTPSGAIRAFVYYRLRGTYGWELAWSATTDVTVTTSIDIPGDPLEIVVGVETATTSGFTTGSLTLSWVAGQGTFNLNGDEPTLSAATATTWRVLDGAVTNDDSGQTVTFDNLIRRDGTLTISASSDYHQRTIENSVSGPILGTVTFSDPVDLFSVDPGGNEISETISGTLTVKHRGTYL